MPERNARILLEDMREHARWAQIHMAGMDFDLFVQTPLVHHAVVRCVEVIGEAARFVPDDIRDLASEIPWSQIVATRHILAHHYAAVDLELVWRVVNDRLPELEAALQRLLERLPPAT